MYQVIPAPKAAASPPLCPHCQKAMEPLLKPYLRKGERVKDIPPVDQIRHYVLDQLKKVPEPEVV